MGKGSLKVARDHTETLPITAPKVHWMTRFSRDRWLYVLLLPGVLYFLIFKYWPMWGVLISFQNYQPFLGFWQSEWVGFEHFQAFFQNPDFFRLFRNTLMLALYDLIFFFPAPIILALLLNEIRLSFYKRFVQTLVYVPHFISMVIVASITYILLTTQGGGLNNLIASWTGEKIDFLSSEDWFRPLIILQIMWKETGWGTIIFLAALAGVDVEQYEAAIMDGAGRFRRMWHITLPAISGVIAILLILRLGSFMDNGFEQIFLMKNSLNSDVADVFDTYVYEMGITMGSFSYSTAVGLFKAVIGIVLVLGSNYIVKRMGQPGLY
ncbi:carbohydrate ABC transporter membrane protein 1 (CUT1 family) [Aureibacillus halotolerans]|uniref:Carbohydrate ABC transporter membrane protein 1 (CUT1 family) n=2 Tax=Aureibacillus halotolerans TaxID=1508390 RepID=A0A4R6UCT9_9BACI|nr:carbohydrate ABC transporter membrane protein 1 (CUT1 family) [Aureibacillus halotolerans]